MKKMLAIILVSLVLSGCEKNGSQNDLIINNTEEENVVMDENDDYELKNIEMGRKEEKEWLENAKGYTVRQIKVMRQILFLKKRQFIQ